VTRGKPADSANQVLPAIYECRQWNKYRERTSAADQESMPEGSDVVCNHGSRRNGKSCGEERKQREVQQKKAEEHKRKAEFITELIENSEEAQRVRMFVRTMTECVSQLELSDEEKRDIQQVVDWTNEYAESLDPLSDLPDSVDGFVDPGKRYSRLKWQ